MGRGIPDLPVRCGGDPASLQILRAIFTISTFPILPVATGWTGSFARNRPTTAPHGATEPSWDSTAQRHRTEWAVVDPATNNIYVTWTQFDNYGSPDPADSSLIMFSRSTDGGQTWSQAARISKEGGDCIDSDNTVEGAVPQLVPTAKYMFPGRDRWDWSSQSRTTRGLHGLRITFRYRHSRRAGLCDPRNIPVDGLPVTCCDLSQGPTGETSISTGRTSATALRTPIFFS